MHRAPRAISAVALGLLLVGCSSSRFGQPEPATEEGEEILGLWQGFFVAACVVGALMLGLIAYAAVRFRRRSDEVPSQKPANIGWEIAYTVTPIVVVAVLFGFSVVTQDRVEHEVANPDLIVNVTGFQWGWQFEYPELGITITGSSEADEVPTLVLPRGQSVRLVLLTSDVVHSFWVPRFLAKRDMIPEVDNAIDVTPITLGRFDGRCAEYCALDHWRMAFTLEVVEPDDLDAAIEAAAEAANGARP